MKRVQPRQNKASADANATPIEDPAQEAVLQAIAALKTELLDKGEEQSVQIKTQLDLLRADFKQATDSSNARIEALETRCGELDVAANDHSDRITSLERELALVREELVVQQARSEDAEQRSRRFNLRVAGIKERREDGKRVTDFVSQCLKDAYGLPTLPTLDIAHRTLRARGDDNGPPRTFVIRCHYYQEREEILKKARQVRRATTADGDVIYANQDFTQAVAKQRAKFNSVRSLLRTCEGVRFGLWYPAELKITTSDGKCASFKDPVKAKDFIQKNLSPRV